jgi:hypothetical protein
MIGINVLACWDRTVYLPRRVSNIVLTELGMTRTLFALPLVHGGVRSFHDAMQCFEVNPVPKHAGYSLFLLLEDGVSAKYLSGFSLIATRQPCFLFHLGFRLVDPAVLIVLLADPINVLVQE